MAHKDYSGHYQEFKKVTSGCCEGKALRGWYEAESGVQVARCGDIYTCSKIREMHFAIH